MMTSGILWSEVRIVRTFDAPRRLVYRAWTDPQMLLEWYAPAGCTIEFRQLDAREGGRYHSCITTPDGHHCWCRGTYRELVPPERIVLTMEVADERGNGLSPVEAGMDPAWPRETVLTVTLAEEDGRTTLTLHQTVDEVLAQKTGALPSWHGMFDRLEELLATADGAAWERGN